MKSVFLVTLRGLEQDKDLLFVVSSFERANEMACEYIQDRLGAMPHQSPFGAVLNIVKENSDMYANAWIEITERSVFD